jgi:transposase
MFAIHPCARTTPAVRAALARSHEPTGVLARRYGISTETVRKWRRRGPEDCLDRSARPHRLPWKASEEERAIVCALRRATGFPLDDLTFVVTHFLPHLNRDAVYRILKAEGLGRLPPASRPRQPSGTFRDGELGFVHLGVRHLPKLRTADGQSRKRYLFVAIDRRSRFARLAVKDEETEASAVAVLGGRPRLPLPGHPRAHRPRLPPHRRGLREAQVKLAIRWFCGYGRCGAVITRSM